jgi:hypothetical protein
MIKLVPVNYIPEVHYPILASWWKAHGWPAIPEKFLPSRGYVVENLAAAFLYSTDSHAAIMEWTVGNPKASGREVYQAIRTLVNHILQVAQDDGFDVVFTALNKKGLLKAYEKEGFRATDLNMTHMIWRRS